MLIIGSYALNHWVKSREINDIDIICTEKDLLALSKKLGSDPIETSLNKYKLTTKTPYYAYKLSRYLHYFKAQTQIEIELAVPGSSGEAYLALKKKGSRTNELPWQSYLYNNGSPTNILAVISQAYFASPEILFSIKKSHIFYPKNWDKHIADYTSLREIVEEDKYSEITKLRVQETEDRLGALKTPSLNKAKDEFFDDKVSNKTFVHDDIHLVMAHREKPMYEYIKIDPNKVACSKEKFFALGYEDRIKCVKEEAYVIALERCIIPMLYEGKKYISKEDAYNWALMRICTTLCSGWFRQFAVDNYTALKYLDLDYVSKFLNSVDSKRIIPISKQGKNV